MDAIHAAFRGDPVVSSRMMAPVLAEFVRRGRAPQFDTALDVLSSAEFRVVATLASGITSNEDIAAMLNVSVHTVRSQLQTALRKTGLADRTQLALWAARQQINPT